MYSDEQLLYFKEYILLKNSGDDVARISSSLFESKITLNPHQISAALSFFRNPKKKGMIFADEVGLGKTIEAGIVISQYWYEQKRKILIISPASLIKQWNEELLEKFHLHSTIIDGKVIKESDFQWHPGIYITSLNTVYLNKERFNTNYDLIIIDEAHKLRNVYKDKGVMAPAIKEVFEGQKKLLLTATPFQNNLLELFGLMSLIDSDIFPDFSVFKEKYIKNYVSNKLELKEIISKYAVRTLREDVKKYINYTKRNVLLANYELTKKEMEIYEKVENLIYSQDMFDIYGTGQLHLIILLLQKLLSSSIYAVKSTLTNMMMKLATGEKIAFTFEELGEHVLDISLKSNNVQKFVLDIESCINFISEVKTDSKLDRLKQSLNEIFIEFDINPNRNRKVLIFTESKKTQEYLYDELCKTYNKILLFNGENKGTQINDIYGKWCEKNNQERIIAKNIAVRKAIVDAFEHDYEILIATDAAAEGLNLQFCSVIINYDLPWNPQKIEQRIGRCHRYGQNNDVIVINMLNNSSNIDKRIYELLSNKLGIFEETFGASDKILGNTNISENLEDAIRNVYKCCRSPKEIEEGFRQLQETFKNEIEEAIKSSELELESYFDEEVVKAFDFQYIEATRIVDEMAFLFYCIIKSCLPDASYDDEELSFTYKGIKHTVLSRYKNSAEFCSILSDFGKYILSSVKPLDKSGIRTIKLNYSNSKQKIGYLDSNRNRKGKLMVSKIIYDSFEMNEALTITGCLNDGTIIPEDICHKILKLTYEGAYSADTNDFNMIKEQHKKDLERKIKSIEDYNASVFQEELNYIDNWADTMIEKVQLSVKQMRDERNQLRQNCDFTSNLSEKASIQEEIHHLGKKINKAWIELAKLEDEIEEKRFMLINNLKAEKDKSIDVIRLFEMEFEII